MKIPPFDAHRHGDSNELLFDLIRPLDSETSWHFWMANKFGYIFFTNFVNFDRSKCHDVSLSSGRMRTSNSSLESPWRCASNGSVFMSLAHIDGKLFAFYVLETFANNFPSICARDIKIPPFDAHRYGLMVIPTSYFLLSYNHRTARYRGLTWLN